MSNQHGHGDHSNEQGSSHPGASQGAELGHYARRVQALEALLTEKGICTQGEIQRAVEETEARSPADGATVVARAWVDSEFKARLLANAKAAVAELGYEAAADLPDVVVAENTDERHHLVVCTLCS
ncbi:MAG: nitrile hydratase subunit alpha, partial [Dehalococcoidia bacterium]